MAECAVVFVDLRSAYVVRLVCGYRNRLRHLFFNSFIESLVGQHFFKWHGARRGGYGRHSSSEVQIDHEHEAEHADQQTKNECLQLALLVWRDSIQASRART